MEDTMGTKEMTPNEYQQLALRTEHTPELLIKRFRYFSDDGRELKVVNPNGKNLGEILGLNHEVGCRVVDMDLLLHGLMGMVTETGEAMDMTKKHLLYGKKFDPVNVLEEAGDLAWYIAIALKACGYTFEECLERNLEKLRKRFPDGFTNEKAIERDLSAERLALEGNRRKSRS